MGHKLLTVHLLLNISAAACRLRLSAHGRIVHLLALLHHLDHPLARLSSAHASHHPEQLVLSLGLLAVEELLHLLHILCRDRDPYSTSAGLGSDSRLSSEELLGLERLLEGLRLAPGLPARLGLSLG